MKQQLFCLVLLMLIGFAYANMGIASAVYNDEGNDSCLVIYSDHQIYRANNPNNPQVITVVLTLENKCGSPIAVNLGLLTERRHTVLVEVKNIETIVGKNREKILNEPTANVLPFIKAGKEFETKQGWANYALADGNTRIVLEMLVPKADGEFAITASNPLAPAQASILDPTYTGTGTFADPYVITTCLELQDMNCVGCLNDPTIFFVLGNNIDCTETKTWVWEDGTMRGFAPIAGGGDVFSGHFDGNNHYIYNLTIYSTTADKAALFADVAYLDVNNLGIHDINVYSTAVRAAGITSTASAHVAMNNVYLLGGTITGKQYVGGIIGLGAETGADKTDLNQVFTKDVNINNGTSADIGGLVGYYQGNLWNCYSTAQIYSTGANKGALIGRTTVGTATSSYWNPTDSIVIASALGTEKTHAQMLQEATYTGWDFVNIWTTTGDTNTPMFYPAVAPPPPPALTADINVTKIEGLPFAPNMNFSAIVDGNLTITASVQDTNNNRMTLDLNYSVSATSGTGTIIVTDLNLDATNCVSLDWATSAVECNWDWNISKALVTDGNYYILGRVRSIVLGTMVDTDFNSSAYQINIANDFNVTIKTPIDEATLLPIDTTSVYTWTVKIVDETGVHYYTGQKDQNSFLTSKSATEVVITIDTNTTDYYARQYFLTTSGSGGSYTLQPYLAKKATAGGTGIQSVLFTRSLNNTAITGVSIKSYKDLPATGKTLIEQITTDSAGSATFSFIQGDTYLMSFTKGATTLGTDVILRPVYSSYQFYFGTPVFNVPDANALIFDVNFFPAAAYIDSNNTIDLNVSIKVTHGTIIDLNIIVYTDNNVLYSQVVLTDGFYDLPPISVVGVKNNNIKFEVLLHAVGSDLLLSKAKNYTINLDFLQSEFNSFILDIPMLINPAGSDRKEVSTFLATLLTIFICGAIVKKGFADVGGIAIFAMLLLGIFAWMGWVYLPVFFLACLICFGLIVFTRSW